MIEKINNFEENKNKEPVIERLNKIKKNVPVYLMPVFLSFITSCVEKKEKNDFETKPVETRKDTKNENGNVMGMIDILLKETSKKDRLEFGLLQDPAFKIVYELDYEKKYPEALNDLSDREKAEWTIRTARNMYVTGVEITEENFNNTLEETIEARSNPEILEKSIFKDRNVAFFAGNEEWLDFRFKEDGRITLEKESRFINEEISESLSSKNPKSLEIFKPEGEKNNYIEKYEEFQVYVATKEDLTLVFNTHGAPNEITGIQEYPDNVKKISDSIEIDFYATISPEILSGMLVSRFKNGITDTPIIVTTSCFGQDFMRSLYEKILEKNKMWGMETPLPIIIASNEYGQYGFSSRSVMYNSQFLKNILDKDDFKIKDALEIEAKSGEGTGIKTNISVFIPVNNNKNYFQIAKDEHKESEASKRLFQDALERGLISDKNISLFEITNPEEADKIRDEFNQNKKG